MAILGDAEAAAAAGGWRLPPGGAPLIRDAGLRVAVAIGIADQLAQHGPYLYAGGAVYDRDIAVAMHRQQLRPHPDLQLVHRRHNGTLQATGLVAAIILGPGDNPGLTFEVDDLD